MTGSAFARSTGLPASFGKSTETLKTRVPDDVKLEFLRLANTLGMDESTLLRTLVLVRLYGQDTVARMHADHLALATGTVPESATSEGAR